MGRAVFILLSVITTVTMSQNISHSTNVNVFGRFGFGGLDALSAAWERICQQRCSPEQRFWINTNRVFCAVNCPTALTPPTPTQGQPTTMAVTRTTKNQSPPVNTPNRNSTTKLTTMSVTTKSTTAGTR